MNLLGSVRMKGAWMAFGPNSIRLHAMTNDSIDQKEGAEPSRLFRRQTLFNVGMEPDDSLEAFHLHVNLTGVFEMAHIWNNAKSLFLPPAKIT